MSDLVTLRLSPVFSDLRKSVERLRDEILEDAKPILRREWALSVRARWFRTGATLNSVVDETVVEGDRKTYRFWPTVTSEGGAPYPLFGEYGTGRRGAETGRPTPAGYRYGSKVGMTARRFSRIAVGLAKPQVNDAARLRLRQFGGVV
jgi:hypothetical protein